MITERDVFYLKYALRLAKKGGAKTMPNPNVGVVIVKDDVIVGHGYHKRYGFYHAEVYAIKMAGMKAKGATCYVTLEPCSHYGKTPPCAIALVNAGISRLIYISGDPNPKVSGCGIKILEDAKITVEKCNELESVDHKLNEAWRYFIVSKMPFVTLKMATGLDGKIATVDGESKWITGEGARNDVQRLRGQTAAILTTADTLIADNAKLTYRLKGSGVQPLRIVLDADLRTDPDADIYNHPIGLGRTLLCTKKSNDISKYSNKNVDFYFDDDNGEHINMVKLFKYLGEISITSILIESGGVFAAAMLKEKLVNRICWYTAPIILGGEKSRSSVLGAGYGDISSAPRLKDIEIKRLGDDIKITGIVV